MRRPRVLIIDDEITILKILKHFFSMRGYEVLSFGKPIICPIYEKNDFCSDEYPCADIIITDLKMPHMNGIELLQAQIRRGCKLTIKNKAIISGYLDEEYKKHIESLGCMFFQKPFEFSQITGWLEECEKRIDLSQPLGDRRKEKRISAFNEIIYKPENSDTVYRGTVVNLSDSGLCLKTSKPLSVEQSLKISSVLYFRKNASVRWIQQSEDGYFMAGLTNISQ